MRALSCIPLACLCLILGACAQRAAEPSAALVDWRSDEATIRGLLQESVDAWNRGDLRGHLAPYAENVIFMTKDGPRPGVAAIEAAFAEKYVKDGASKQTLRFEQLTVRRLDDDAALAIGRFVLVGGSEPEQSGWFSTVWIRGADGWKTVHDHSS